MKKHFNSLFDPVHRLWTISIFLCSAVLIVTSVIIGINDNPPGIVMFLTGIILLFFTLLHPWRKAKNYLILSGLCIGILVLEYLGIHMLDRLGKAEYISEGVAMGVAFVFCLPGFLVGIIGALICAFRKK
jgi:hypothetical protein